MKIELLFPEYANLFGDQGNILYLKRCLPQAEFIETALHAQPLFATEKPDLIYMGPLSEPAQEKAIQSLLPYRERIGQLIEEGACFFFTGNAMEVLFKEIKDGGRTIPGLGLLGYTAIRNFQHRHNSNFIGDFEGQPLLGCKTQFTLAYGDNSGEYIAKAERGMGLNPENPLEGVHRKNFIGTYLVGPLLVMSPPFTRYLLKMMGAEVGCLPFEEALERAYAQRLKEFRDPLVHMEKAGDTNQLKINFSPKAWFNHLNKKRQR